MKIISEQFNSLEKEDKSLGNVKYTSFPANIGSFWPFSIQWEECFDQKHDIYMCFPSKLQKLFIFLGKMQEISPLEANIGSFQQILVKYLPFSHQALLYGQRFGSS